METVTGIFASVVEAERATHRLQSVLSSDKITLLVPGEMPSTAGSVELAAGEQPGMGKAVAGAIGAAMGVAGGVGLATALVPGVGSVIALGMLGGTLLGFLGAEAGESLEKATGGLPEDEFFVYEDALRRGHSVLIAAPEDASMATAVRTLLEQEGAESVDAAREHWWIGLRSAEQEHYSSKEGAQFDRDERFYRLGFEAAVHARNRCKEYDQILSEMQADIEEFHRRYPGASAEEAFRRGFERGREYYQRLCSKVPERETR